MTKIGSIAQLAASGVLYMLLILSVLSISVIVERWWFFRKRRLRIDVSQAFGTLNIKELEADPSIEVKIAKEALLWHKNGPKAVQEILEKGIKMARRDTEKGLVFLGTLGNNAPFLGLFGTVLGVISAFRDLGAVQRDVSSGMGNVMSSIGDALVCTAVGILVALPAVVAYNVFQKKAAEIEERASALGNLILANMDHGESN